MLVINKMLGWKLSSPFIYRELQKYQLDLNFKGLIEDLHHLWEMDQNVVQEKLPAESLIDLDNNVVTAAAVSGDEEIIAKI